MMRLIAALFIGYFAVASAPALAQPATQKDRKDYLLEALESQRNDALAKTAVCYAEANEQIVRLRTQLSEAQTALEAERKKAEAPPKP